MKKSSSDNFKLRIQRQYDRLCCKALEGELKDYYRRIRRTGKKEVLFCEMSETEMNRLSAADQYKAENCQFVVFEYEIEITNELLAEALKQLTKRKRDVILLSFFEEMTDVEIAEKMNLVRSTVNEHKQRSLKILKEYMKGYITDDESK